MMNANKQKSFHVTVLVNALFIFELMQTCNGSSIDGISLQFSKRGKRDVWKNWGSFYKVARRRKRSECTYFKCTFNFYQWKLWSLAQNILFTHLWVHWNETPRYNQLKRSEFDENASQLVSVSSTLNTFKNVKMSSRCKARLVIVQSKLQPSNLVCFWESHQPVQTGERIFFEALTHLHTFPR